MGKGRLYFTTNSSEPANDGLPYCRTMAGAHIIRTYPTHFLPVIPEPSPFSPVIARSPSLEERRSNLTPEPLRASPLSTLVFNNFKWERFERGANTGSPQNLFLWGKSSSLIDIPPSLKQNIKGRGPGRRLFEGIGSHLPLHNSKNNSRLTSRV